MVRWFSLVGVVLSTAVGAAGAIELGAARLVRDIAQTAHPRASSGPANFVRVGDRVLFTAYDRQHGRELWVTDGSIDGTRLLVDLIPGVGDEGANAGWSDPIVLNGVAITSRPTTCWSCRSLVLSDGTVEGTELFADIRVSEGPVLAGDRAFFVQNQSLWLTDGTRAGTRLVANLPDLLSESPENVPWYLRPVDLIAVGDDVCFRIDEDGSFASDDDSPYPSIRDLWCSDGTTDGTRPVRDIRPGAGPTLRGEETNDFSETVLMENVLYFLANDGETGMELWRTDATEAGTWQVKDIHPGSGDAFGFDDWGWEYHPELVVYDGTLYFIAANDGANFELWRSDGTAEGTRQVTDLTSEPFGLYSCTDPAHGPNCSPDLYLYLGKLFLQRIDVSPQQYYSSDGTADGTRQLAEYQYPMAEVRPWGEVAGHELSIEYRQYPELPIVRDQRGDVLLRGYTGPMTPVGRGAVFSFGTNDEGYEPWFTDGTPSGTFRLADIFQTSADSRPLELTDLDGALLFTADDGVHGRELWHSDGTADATIMLADIHAGAAPAEPRHLFRFGDFVYFSADDGIHGRELWRSDGTVAGTSLVADIYPGTGSSIPRPLVVWRDRLVLYADDGVHGYEPVSIGVDGDARLIADLAPGPSGSRSAEPDRFYGMMQVLPSGELLLSADDGVVGHEFWRTDGSAAGTQLVRELVAGPVGMYPPVGSWVGGRYVLGVHTVYWAQTWETDGTADGTRPLPILATRFSEVAGGIVGFGRLREGGLARIDDAWTSETVLPRTEGRHFGMAVTIGGSLFLRDDRVLVRSDGTEPGTGPIAYLGDGVLRIVGDRLLVTRTAEDWSSRKDSFEIAASDGRTFQLQNLASIPWPTDMGSIRNSPQAEFAVAGDSLYFTASHPDVGLELWALPLAAVPTVCAVDCVPTPVPTATPTPTRTPTPTHTHKRTRPPTRTPGTPVVPPTPACHRAHYDAPCASVSVAPLRAGRGDVVEVQVDVDLRQGSVAGLQWDLLPPLGVVVESVGGRPHCRVVDGFVDVPARFVFRTEDAADGVRVLVLSTDDLRVMADGHHAVRCRAKVANDAALGFTKVALERVVAADLAGRSMPVGRTPGSLEVVVPTGSASGAEGPSGAACDCNGDMRVTVDELLTLTTVALGSFSIDRCPNLVGHAAFEVTHLIGCVEAALLGLRP